MKRGRSLAAQKCKNAVLVVFLTRNKDVVLPIITKLDKWADVAHLFATCRQMRQLATQLTQLPGGIWHLMLNLFYPFSHHPPEVLVLRDSLQWPKTHRYEFFQCFLLAVHFKYGTALDRAELLYENCSQKTRLSFCGDSLHLWAFELSYKNWRLQISECHYYWKSVFEECDDSWSHRYLNLTERTRNPIEFSNLMNGFLTMWTRDNKILNHYCQIPK